MLGCEGKEEYGTNVPISSIVHTEATIGVSGHLSYEVLLSLFQACQNLDAYRHLVTHHYLITAITWLLLPAPRVPL